MPSFRIPPKVRDWLLIVFYLGFGGPVFVIATWLILQGEYELAFRRIFGLVFFAVVVFAGFFILAQRLRIAKGDAENERN